MQTTTKVNFPTNLKMEDIPSSTTGFNANSVGTGSFTGLAYTVPAYTKGTIKADLEVMCITTEDVKTLNSLVDTMLSSSAKSKIASSTTTKASADLSFWDFLFGGASASVTHSNSAMHSLGLTTDQITIIVKKLFDIASKMSHVSIDFEVENQNHDFSVSGDLELFTIGGTVSSGKETKQYRMLANQGTAGNSSGQAPAKGKIIPMK